MDQRTAPAKRVSSSHFLIVALAHMTINVPFRIVYPFLPSIARGLGISLTAASGLITLWLTARMGSPFLGPLADRYGRRRVMAAALLLLISASLLLAGGDTLAAAGIAKALYDPAVYAYLGDTVSYRKRCRAIGALKLSWSSAWLLGVPASGFLIEYFGWRTPWVVLIGLGSLGMWLTPTALLSTSVVWSLPIFFQIEQKVQ